MPFTLRIPRRISKSRLMPVRTVIGAQPSWKVVRSSRVRLHALGALATFFVMLGRRQQKGNSLPEAPS